MRKKDRHNSRKKYVKGQNLYLRQNHSSLVFGLYQKKKEEQASVLEKIFVKKKEEEVKPE